MKEEQDKKEFNIRVLVDDDIIEDQGKKQDGNPDQRNQDGLGKFTQPCLAKNLAVGSYQGVEAQPEKRDDGNTVVKLLIENDIIQMAEYLVIYGILAVDKEQCPGNKSR